MYMSKEDLMNAFGVSVSDFSNKLQDQIQTALIINIYLHNGELIKLGQGSPDKLMVSSIVDISNDFLTIQYDSHDTDILFSAISKIEYFY